MLPIKSIRVPTAYHEAGHAVICVLYGWEVNSISIEPEDLDKEIATAGITHIRIGKSVYRTTEYTDIPHDLRVLGYCVAGYSGEKLFHPIISLNAFLDDFGRAWPFAWRHLNPEAEYTEDVRTELNESLRQFMYFDDKTSPLRRLLDEEEDRVSGILTLPNVREVFQNLVQALLTRGKLDGEACNNILVPLYSSPKVST